MNRTRRILLASSLLVLTSGAALGAFLAGPEVPDSANAPWRNARRPVSDWRIWALSHAILAPNPHNLQPWIADLREPDVILLSLDPGRRLPHTDPFGRQLLIGAGCFIELLTIAAAEHGHALAMQYFPDALALGSNLFSQRATGDATPFVRITLRQSGAAAADPLYPAIFERRSVKEPFDLLRAASLPQVQALEQAMTTVEGPHALRFHSSHEPRLVADLRRQLWAGWQVEANTSRTMKESVDLMRIGRSEVIASPDGIDLGSPMMTLLKAAGQLERAGLGTPGTSAFAAGQRKYRELIDATPGMFWITSRANDRLAEIASGRAYMRVCLQAASAGLAVHPMSQVLQEFPEMAASFDEIHRTLGVAAPARIQMLARLGFGPAVAPAPRREVASIIRA